MKRIQFAALLATLILALLLLVQQGFAQPSGPAEDKSRKFGFYNEKNLDAIVKVQGGQIRIYRSWRGDTKEWTINPQHEPLQLSQETEGSAYGRELAKEISRGPRTFSQGVTALTGFYGGSSSSGSGGSGGAPSQVSAAVGFLVASNQINYCTNEGEQPVEAVSANAEGYKWINRIGRSWAQFDEFGEIVSWGQGNYLTGKVVRGANNEVNGYADTFDNQVITYTRNAAGQIETISDYSGLLVTYVYNAQGRIEDVLVEDGPKSHYDYVDGNITGKTIGDVTGATPGQEIGEETSFIFTYYPDGQLLSIRNGDLTGIDFEYQYDDETGLYTVVERASGNRITETVSDQEDGLRSIKKNGQYEVRVEQLCEDTAIFDRHNRLTYVDRNALGFIRDVYFPDGRILHFEHSNENWPELNQAWNAPALPWGIVSITMPSGAEVHYTRRTDGRIASAIETFQGENRYWFFAYDQYGNMIEQRLQKDATPDAAKDIIYSFGYDNYGNLQYVEDPITLSRWNYEYTARGDIKKITSPDGKIWNFQYNKRGQLKQLDDPVGYREVYEYTKRGLLRRYKETYETGQPDAVTTYLYNHRGLVKKIIDPLSHEWLFDYNEAGELRVETDPLQKTTSYDYDFRGRIKSVQDGNNVSVTYDYFDTSLPGQAPQTTVPFSPLVKINYPTYVETLAYDLSGRLSAREIKGSTTNETLLTRFTYDLDGRLEKIIRPDNQEIRYSWDRLSRPTSIIEPGRGTSGYQYPEGGRQILYNDPVGGTITQNFDALGRMLNEQRADQTQVSMTYNQNGYLEHYIDGEGRKIEYLYNDAQEVNEVRTYPTATATVPSRTITFNRNLRGDLLGFTENTMSMSTTLDPLGRVLSSSINYGSFSKGHSYTYTANGLPETYTAADGTTYTYQWDAANQFQGMTIPGTGAISYDYDQQNWYQPKSVTYPGGAKQSYEYDDLRRLKRIHSTNPAGATLLDYNYTFLNGALSGSVVDTITTEHGLYDYSYDLGFRLTAANTPQGQENYTYDFMDRRQPGSGGTWSYNENGAVEDTGSVSLTYDDEGNLSTRTSGGVTSNYFYDDSSRLIRVEQPLGTVVAEYGYDILGRRLWKEVSGVRTYFYYTEEGLSAELDSSGNVVKSYLFEPGGYWTTAPLAQKDGSNYHFYHNDHLGTPQKLTDQSGAVSWTGRYEAFGRATVLNSSVSNNLRFPGQYFDAETGFHQNFQRNYDPTLGTYLEQDPYGVAFTGPNRYGYALGNPVNYMDPRGEAPIVVLIPVIVEYTFYALAVYSGFEAFECYQKHWQDGCTFWDLAECHEQAVYAVLGYGAGRAVQAGRKALQAKRALAQYGDDLGNATGVQGVSESAPNFVVSQNGTVYPVPTGATGPYPVINNQGKLTGQAFTGGRGGANGQVDTIRLMDATPPRGGSPGYPNGYIKYENSASPKPQGVNPYTGKTLPNSKSHLPIE